MARNDLASGEAFKPGRLVHTFIQARKLLPAETRAEDLYYLIRSRLPVHRQFIDDATSIFSAYEIHSKLLAMVPLLLEELFSCLKQNLPIYQPPLEGDPVLLYKSLIDGGLSSVEVYHALYERYQATANAS